jgi:uncharacterized OB-fold protein
MEHILAAPGFGWTAKMEHVLVRTMASLGEAGALVAPYVLEYTYRRSVGPVLGRFLAGLRDARVLGVKTSDGRVLVPPAEYDPDSGEATKEMVELPQTGTVTSWSWVDSPSPKQPLDRPFAWALVKIDGATTAMLHAVDAGSADKMTTGLRVRVAWRAERSGSIRDIACFVPLDAPHTEVAKLDGEPLKGIKTPMRLDFQVNAGGELSRYLRSVAEGKLFGRRCPACTKVYVPPRGGCPTCSVPMGEEVQVKDVGTVVSFCIVNVPFEGQVMKLPYVYASILADGADISFPHLIQGIEPGEVRMGLRVKAVWVPPAERKPTMESIRWFEPAGEPDAAFDSYKEHT